MKQISLCLLLAAGLHADTLLLKNGQSLIGKTFVRQGDALFLTAGANGEPVTSEAGVPMTEITEVECEPPALLKKAPELLAAGKISSLLVDIDAALKAADTYGDLPGSHWPALLVLQAHSLLAIGKDAEAGTIAAAMKKTRNPGLVLDSQGVRALIAARKGDHLAAESFIVDLKNDTSRPSAMAAAAVVRGLGLLEKKRFEEALKAFLELPVFLPDETALSGIALLGSARAYHGMEDFDRAIAALETLIKTRPATPEVSTAQTLLPEWKHRHAVIQEAKEP
jgi:tetratricopeptide (TPR) repeat protein